MTNKALQKACPRLVVTMGEAAGIGPELIVKISQLEFSAQLVVLADAALLRMVAKRLGITLGLIPIDWDAEIQAHQPGHLFIEQHDLQRPVQAGVLDRENARTTLSILYRASELALQGKVDAIVTAPVHKANINQIDPEFLGHTEFLAKQASVEPVVMMLACENLRISLATTHLPLAKVTGAITQKSLTQLLEVMLSAFKRFGLGSIKIAVCGLNPHAGENGLLGKEDDEIIRPVIEKFQLQKKNISGPFPADTLFTPQKRAEYDVFLAMYHDQGLPVVKAFGFGRCVNVTLGLPYIRTSVDHGTALDIAADYCASSDSLQYAINYAIQLIAGKLPV